MNFKIGACNLSSGYGSCLWRSRNFVASLRRNESAALTKTNQLYKQLGQKSSRSISPVGLWVTGSLIHRAREPKWIRFLEFFPLDELSLLRKASFDSFYWNVFVNFSLFWRLGKWDVLFFYIPRVDIWDNIYQSLFFIARSDGFKYLANREKFVWLDPNFI